MSGFLQPQQLSLLHGGWLICVSHLHALLQIDQQLQAARKEVDAARTSAAATQQELNEERRSRLAAEKLVAELRSKLDAVKQASVAAGAAEPAAAGRSGPNGAKVAAAAVSGGEKVAVAAGRSNGSGPEVSTVPASGKKGGKKGGGKPAASKGFGSK